MTRAAPPIPPPEVKPRTDNERITQVRRYRLITPLFGGGVTPGEADPVTVVRGAEVRGHLRFWWRATRGAFGDDLMRMKTEEESIWGSPGAKDRAGPSDVTLSVVLRNGGKPLNPEDSQGRPVRHVGEVRSRDSYVAFPLREKLNAVVLEEVEFDLELNFKASYKRDVEAALWAWETFGGIGARTRRGFGALQCTHLDGTPVLPPDVRQARASIVNGLKTHVVTEGHWHDEVPHLDRDLLPTIAPINGSSDGIEAWRFLIDRFKKFRQARYLDDNKRPFGRSQWPEPDEIRRKTDNSAPKHQKYRKQISKFPRGRFGLPIIFQFKDEDVQRGDPEQSTLQGAGRIDRFASRLILRPIACAGGKAVGLAAVLAGPKDPPGGYALKTKMGDHAVDVRLNRQEALDIEPLRGEPDVLQAFLNSL
jgi:CRISPR-associated protein Cmr1